MRLPSIHEDGDLEPADDVMLDVHGLLIRAVGGVVKCGPGTFIALPGLKGEEIVPSGTIKSIDTLIPS
jgi:hypothetical protein